MMFLLTTGLLSVASAAFPEKWLQDSEFGETVNGQIGIVLAFFEHS
jgi:hypothetical protein